MMKKNLLLLALLFFIKTAFSQTAQWSAWTSVSCYKGIQYSINNLGYNKSTKNYWWNVRWRNSYSKPVSFDGEVIIDGENTIHGGFGVIQPGGTQQYTSVPYKSGSTNFAVSVTKVCFADKYGGCSANIPGFPNYASCDNGVPNYAVNPQAAGGSQQAAGNTNTTISSAPSSAEYWAYYNRATAEGKAGNYDQAAADWQGAIRTAVNDAQRDNAKAWLAEVQKAKSNSANTSNNTISAQRTQSAYTPSKESFNVNNVEQDRAKTKAIGDFSQTLIKGLADIAADSKLRKEQKQAEAENAVLEAQRKDEAAINTLADPKVFEAYCDFVVANMDALGFKFDKFSQYQITSNSKQVSIAFKDSVFVKVNQMYTSSEPKMLNMVSFDTYSPIYTNILEQSSLYAFLKELNYLKSVKNYSFVVISKKNDASFRLFRLEKTKPFASIYMNGYQTDLYKGANYYLKNFQDEIQAKLSSSNNNAKDLIAIGDSYKSGNGVEKSDVKAMEYYTKAAQLGEIEALHSIAEMYFSAQDFQTAKQ